MLNKLDDNMLIEIYQRALKTEVDDEFLELLHVELKKRNININEIGINKNVLCTSIYLCSNREDNQ